MSDKIVIRSLEDLAQLGQLGRKMSLAEYGARMDGDIKDAEIDRLTRERDEARKESDRLYTECEQLWNEYKKMCEIIKTIGARCVELDDREAVSAILDITKTFLENNP